MGLLRPGVISRVLCQLLNHSLIPLTTFGLILCVSPSQPTCSVFDHSPNFKSDAEPIWICPFEISHSLEIESLRQYIRRSGTFSDGASSDGNLVIECAECAFGVIDSTSILLLSTSNFCTY